MGGALVRGWIEALRKGGGLTLTVVEPSFDPVLERELEAVGAVLNPTDAGHVDVLVLAVKPQTFPSVVESVRKFVGENTRVMSIMAGVTMDTLSRDLAAQRVIRCVPNTPARI